MPKLTYSAGGESRTVEVGDSCSIGRDDTNTIVLDASSGASRRHCQIIKLGKGKYELADLGSTNGTNVNGRQVKRHKLQHGDRIRIGESELEYSDPENAPDDEIDIEDEISLEEPSGGGARRGGASGDECYLVYAGGAKDGQKVALDKSRVTFGRKGSNTVVIEDTMTSGYHCEIAREGGAYILRDLGSTNGTLLDGDPITEVPLQHGGRLGVGSQRLVFVDPSVKGFEDAMSGVEDLGSEWGLLRAEMDMDRVQKARRSQAVAILGVLFVVGAAGVFFYTNPDMFREQAAALEPVEGNQLADFSFEGGEGNWTPVSGSPARARADSGEGKQGERFLVVSRDGASGAPAVVEEATNSRGIDVSPGKTYEFGGWVKATAGGQGAVRIRWVGSSPDAIQRMNSTALVGGSAWARTRVTVKAPSDAQSAHVQLVNAGPGSVSFDDIFLRSASGAGEVSVTNGDVTISASADGAISIRRGTDLLVEQGSVTGGVFLDGEDRTDRRGDRLGSMSDVSVSAVDGGVELTGKVFDPASGEFGDVALNVSSTSDNLVVLSGTLPASAAFVAGLPRQFVEQSVGVFTASGRSFRMSETRLVPKVKSVTIGNLKRFRMRGTGGEGVFAIGLFSRGEGFEIAIGGSGGTLGVELNTNSESLRGEVRKLGDSARDAESQERYGLAIQRYSELLGQLTQGSREAEAASAKIRQLVESGQTRLAQLEVFITDANEFEHVGDLTQAAELATKLQTSYEGHPIADRAAAQLQRVEKGLSGLLNQARDKQAAPILAMAEDHVKNKQMALGRALLRDVVIRFPGTAAAKSAEKRLTELGSGN